jgi:hypothetical protein
LLLTPELARGLLNTVANARLAQWKIVHLAKTIAADRFPATTIIVTKDGRLVDGRHRCAAVVRSGVPIRVYLTAADYEPVL